MNPQFDSRLSVGRRHAALISVLGFPVAAAAQASAKAAPGNVPAGFPRQDLAAVQAVAGASHNDFEKVKELVSARPALARASWDWGFGDWESPLGAASHMGRVDIAQFLIDHGAEPNLFTHAMLGNLAVVRAAVEATPGIQRTLGPHGLTLAHHARMTGNQKGNPAGSMAKAAEVLKYLGSLGDADTGQTSLKTSPEELERYVGSFRFGEGMTDLFHVEIGRNGLLGLKPEGGVNRFLHRVEDHGFAPSGVPSVRIRFRVEAGKVIALTVHDPEPLVTATRA